MENRIELDSARAANFNQRWLRLSILNDEAVELMKVISNHQSGIKSTLKKRNNFVCGLILVFFLIEMLRKYSVFTPSVSLEVSTAIFIICLSLTTLTLDIWLAKLELYKGSCVYELSKLSIEWFHTSGHQNFHTFSSVNKSQEWNEIFLQDRASEGGSSIEELKCSILQSIIRSVEYTRDEDTFFVTKVWT